MEAAHTQLLLHMEVRWLSRWRVLSRFYDLMEDLHFFITSDISQALNAVDKSMQGKSETILTYTDKINTFKEDLTLWGARIREQN
jgi:hypothetical protein